MSNVISKWWMDGSGTAIAIPVYEFTYTQVSTDSASARIIPILGRQTLDERNSSWKRNLRNYSAKKK